VHSATLEDGPRSRSHRDTIRILAVGNMYPPQHVGGYEVVWQQAMRQAREQGHEVRILTSDYRNADQPEEDPDVHRALRWYWDFEQYDFPRLTPGQRLLLERHNARTLAGHLRAFSPDVVAWWPMGGMSLSLIEQVRRAGVPAVSIVHDDWLVYGPERDQWIRIWRGRGRRLARLIDRLSGVPTNVDLESGGRLVFNSHYTLERAQEAGVDTSEASVIYPGIDDRFLNPVAQRPWEWRIAIMGRIDRQKGIDTAVAALSHLPAASLTIWGGGDDSYVAELLALADRLGVTGRLQFRGFARPEQLRDAYAAADVVAFPVRWNEPFGLVPLEAMGVGRPVVTTARGGTAEFVRDGINALVFPADDDKALAACVSRLADDEALRATLCQEGGRTAARFPAAEFAKRTARAITSAADGGIAPPQG
jgi:glycogen synthase